MGSSRLRRLRQRHHTGGLRQLLTAPCTFLGRRGGVLLTIGVAWTLQGVSIGVVGDPAWPDDAALLHLAVPVPIRISLWVGTGVLAILGATVNRPRWERWGYMALVLMPMERAASFTWAWVTWLIATDVGYERGWVAALSWAVTVLLIVIISGWEEPRRVLDDATTETQ